MLRVCHSIERLFWGRWVLEGFKVCRSIEGGLGCLLVVSFLGSCSGRRFGLVVRWGGKSIGSFGGFRGRVKPSLSLDS